jgi:hypothetical protein
MLPNSSFLLKRYLPTILIASLLAVAGGAIYVGFIWDWVKYPNFEGALERCYSPNHEYYIVFRQSWLESKSYQPHARGTAKLYDKTGKLLYSNKTYLSLEFGPTWSDDIRGHPGAVSFQGTEEPGWGYDLPSPTGISNYSGSSRRCY